MTTYEIPTIDMRALAPGSAAAKTLDDACREWGFFQLTGHGLAAEVASDAWARTQEFFALPLEAKRAVSRSEDNPWGFYDRELTKNRRDWKEIFDFGPAEECRDPGGEVRRVEVQWPAGLPEFARAMGAHYRECERVAFRLLEALSANLGMPPHHLADAFRPNHTSFVRLNYYPACADAWAPDTATVPDRGHLAVNQHTDAGAFTLLLQAEQDGLQVHRHGAWHTIEPQEGALVVNIGDVVQVWSNDRYEAALHRVLANPKAERFSIPYFFNPAYTADYAPLPSLCSADQPARYRPINWGEFRAGRAAGDYQDLGEEIQIEHFRISI